MDFTETLITRGLKKPFFPKKSITEVSRVPEFMFIGGAFESNSFSYYSRIMQKFGSSFMPVFKEYTGVVQALGVDSSGVDLRIKTIDTDLYHTNGMSHRNRTELSSYVDTMAVFMVKHIGNNTKVIAEFPPSRRDDYYVFKHFDILYDGIIEVSEESFSIESVTPRESLFFPFPYVNFCQGQKRQKMVKFNYIQD